MSRHLSVRLAWHDTDWNGHVCNDPAGNVYCTGAHSLLSDRIARDKETDREANAPNVPLDNWGAEYLPPCYWSSNAFSPEARRVFHAHPFQALKEQLRISDELPPFSVFTWPRGCGSLPPLRGRRAVDEGAGGEDVPFLDLLATHRPYGCIFADAGYFPSCCR